MNKINKENLKALIKSLTFTIILSLSVIVPLCSCGTKSTEKADNADPFTPILGYEKDGLVYMNLSKTVYVLFTDGSGSSKRGFLALYVQNGHTCEYINGEIVEIIPEIKSGSDSSTVSSPDDILNSLSDEERESLLNSK